MLEVCHLESWFIFLMEKRHENKLSARVIVGTVRVGRLVTNLRFSSGGDQAAPGTEWGAGVRPLLLWASGCPGVGTCAHVRVRGGSSG